MWQNIIVAVIVIVSFIIVLWKIYRFVTGEKPSRCDSCAGCALKEQLKKRSEDCKDYRVK